MSGSIVSNGRRRRIQWKEARLLKGVICNPVIACSENPDKQGIPEGWGVKNVIHSQRQESRFCDRMPGGIGG